MVDDGRYIRAWYYRQSRHPGSSRKKCTQSDAALQPHVDRRIRRPGAQHHIQCHAAGKQKLVSLTSICNGIAILVVWIFNMEGHHL